MKENWIVAEAEVKKNRKEIIEKLLRFATTDMLLFWGDNKDLADRQKKLWAPVLQWMQEALKVKFKTTKSIDVPEQDQQLTERMHQFLESLSDRELVAFFKAALNMRSVLLAAALVRGKITADEAFEAAYIEEIWQAENWGVVEEAKEKREILHEELKEIEEFLKSIN